MAKRTRKPSLIRHKQRSITAIKPHANNRRFIVPKRPVSTASPGVPANAITTIAGDPITTIAGDYITSI